MWNNDYLIGACSQFGLKIFDFKKTDFPQTMSGFKECIDVKKIIHPVYGESLLILTHHEIYRNLCLGINNSFL